MNVTMDFIVKTFQELTTQELYEILKARFSTFVTEQHCFYLDPDGIDYDSLHVFAIEEGRVTAYARLFAEQEEGVWHVGRVLTVKRGTGVGRSLMERTIHVAKEHGAAIIRMEAQLHAAGFYEKLGFTVCSEEFEEAGIPHVKMEFIIYEGTHNK